MKSDIVLYYIHASFTSSKCPVTTDSICWYDDNQPVKMGVEPTSEINELFPCNRIHLAKLTVIRLLCKFLAFYATEGSLSRSQEFTSYQCPESHIYDTVSLRFILMSYHTQILQMSSN
jgi:hypothetical protein